MKTQDHRLLWSALLVLIAALALAACAPTTEGVSGAPEEEAAIEPEAAQPTEAPTDEPTPTEEVTEEPTEAPETANAVEVDDQTFGEDNTVTIARIMSDTIGWMVIHADADGPGPVIGFSPVQAGENLDVVVEVDPAQVTETLHAMLHVDDGEEGTYEFPDGDPPARDAEGNVVNVPFTVEGAPGAGAGDVTSVGLEMVAGGLAAPVDLEPAPDDSGRLFVVDQVGVISIVTADGEMLEEPFLDISEQIVPLEADYDERGLLGLAFHPGYAENGRFFVYYSAPPRETTPAGWPNVNVVSEFTVSADDENTADPASERELLVIDEPQPNHNGGDISFGPDGYLYVPLGDGGGANDVGEGHVSDWYEDNEGGNAQDLTENFLGAILRIDVDAGDPYAIPEDNPVLGDASEPTERWAFGFRNPWRATWDAETGEYYVADAGQDLWEEVSLVESGGNYGWNVMEGTHCFDAENPEEAPEECPDADPWGNELQLPIIEFPNSNQEGGNGLVVVGGYVYHGSAIPGLEGQYVFGQWSQSFEEPLGSLMVAAPAEAEGEMWSVRDLSFTAGEDGELALYVLAFGQGADGELYVLTSEMAGPSGDTGTVWRIVPAEDGGMEGGEEHDMGDDQDDAGEGEDDAGEGEDDMAEPSGEAAVSMAGSQFQPAEITVAPGTTVVWTNDAGLPHSVTADDGTFDSGAMSGGDTFSWTFDEPGEYPYYCQFHGGPGGQGMSGVVIVSDE